MKVLSVNAGSSSLKFSLFDMANNNVLASGVFERIGIEGSTFTIKFNGEKIVQEVELNNHVDAVNILIDRLISLDIIKSLEEINGIGHRVAHGKDYFDKSTIINDSVLEKLREVKDMAPLHNPANLLGIEAFEKVLPDSNVWIFTFCLGKRFHLVNGEIHSCTLCFLEVLNTSYRVLLNDILFHSLVKACP